ncbi:hypothetical protein [Streptomyces sp. NPDC051776]|uniref:hypothetical protein n=1 Tax=Streptomyces sp. NPDC051776 TaxID=3155414 RepID=UPI0034368249
MAQSSSQSHAQRSAAERELEQALATGPFPLALRTALSVRGLPLHRVKHRLAQRGVTIGVTSLSYWQQGARRPQRPESLRAVRVLEEVLDLPARSLARLLEPASGRCGGPERPAARSYRTLKESSSELERILAALGSPVDGGLHTVAHHERVRLGPRRELLTRNSQQVVRAHREGVDRYLAIHYGDAGWAREHVAVHATENCRVGRVRWHAGSGVMVAELLFETRLRSGETFVFGYGFEDGTGGTSTEHVRGFTLADGQYMLQVRFDDAALPVRCHRFAQTSAGAPRTGRQELALSRLNRTVHLVEQRVRPGLLGIGWNWG